MDEKEEIKSICIFQYLPFFIALLGKRSAHYFPRIIVLVLYFFEKNNHWRKAFKKFTSFPNTIVPYFLMRFNALESKLTSGAPVTQ